jgi:hypothetical protein
MNNEETFTTEAYKLGVKAAEECIANNLLDPLKWVNPYEYGSEDWQCWNLGWNYTLVKVA